MDSSSIVETIAACKKENWRPSPSDSDTPIPTSFQLLIDLLKDQSLFLGKLSPQSPSFDGTIAGAGATIVTLLMKLPESVLVSTVVCEQAYHFVHALGAGSCLHHPNEAGRSRQVCLDPPCVACSDADMTHGDSII